MRDESPFDIAPPAYGHHVARTAAGPEGGVFRGEFMVQCFVDAAAHGVLALAGETVFDAVPEDEDDSEDGEGDDEPPFYIRVGFKGRDVHAKEADGEC